MSGTTTDLTLLRWLRAPVDDTEVLNAGGPSAAPGDDLAERLLHAARQLVAQAGREGVPSAAIAGSAEFAAYRALTRGLRGLDPRALYGRRTRTAFWVNIYNALVIDAVISYGVDETVRELPGFFRRAAYQVGPYRFALDDIEHGLLRGNRPLLARLAPPFAPDDRRATLGPGLLDARVHFALNCGTRSCPPVATYDAARLDEQLDAAAASFINAEGAHLDRGEAVISPIFDLYADDFGGPEGARGWVLRYLVDADLRRLVETGAVRGGTYDWSLNRG